MGRCLEGQEQNLLGELEGRVSSEEGGGARSTGFKVV
jgi:hypothetical protein